MNQVTRMITKIGLPAAAAAVLLMICFTCSSRVMGAPTPAAYLRQGIGARALGMGNAFVAAADDGTALFWNPAGIGLGNRIELTTSHANLSEGRKHDNVSFAYPAGRFGLAAGYIFFGLEGIPHTELNTSKIIGYHNGLPVYDITTLGYFDDKQHSLAFGGSYQFQPTLRFGGSLKLLNHKILDKSATGYALDLGGLWKWNDDLTLGLSFRNLMGTLKWNTVSNKEEEIKFISTVGASYRVLDSLMGNLDIFTEGDNRFDFRLGAEWRPMKGLVALRAGLDQSQLCLGAGISMGWWNIDYAFADQNIGDIHRLSINLAFDRNFFQKPPDKPRLETREVPGIEIETLPPVSGEPVPPSPAPGEPKISVLPELIARQGDYLIGNTPVIRLFIKEAPSGVPLVEAPFMLEKAGLLTTLDQKTGLITAALGATGTGKTVNYSAAPELVQMEVGSFNVLVDRTTWIVMQAAPEYHDDVLFLPLEDICRLFKLALTKATKDIYR